MYVYMYMYIHLHVVTYACTVYYMYIHVHVLTVLCSFAALFSPAKRRQLEKTLDGTPRRPILGAGKSSDDEQDGGE